MKEIQAPARIAGLESSVHKTAGPGMAWQSLKKTFMIQLAQIGAWSSPPRSCGDCQQSDVAKLARRMANRAPPTGADANMARVLLFFSADHRDE